MGQETHTMGREAYGHRTATGQRGIVPCPVNQSGNPGPPPSAGIFLNGFRAETGSTGRAGPRKPG